MKVLVLPVLLVLSLPPVMGQNVSNSSLSEMVETERAFITMAREQNRKDAFLFYLSDSAVTQWPTGPMKGKARIQQQQVTDDLLSWEIAYSDMAGSGDFGYNTGPWEYRATKTDERPAAFGEFNSVWKKEADGTWKNVLDLGVGHGTPGEPVTWTSSNLPLPFVKGRPSNAESNEVNRVEKDFLESIRQDRKSAYRNALSTEARMMVAGHLPFSGQEELDQYLDACPTQSNNRIIGSETARSEDMGYVYGTVDVPLSRDEKAEIKKATFVRIWKKEGGKKWKIVLDVLSY